jgi:hypothetical protein
MNLTIKKYTFNKINDSLERNELILPDCQNSLIDEKVEGLIKSYKKNKEFWHIKKIITIGKLDKKLYIIDGQHRIEASKILYEIGERDDLLFHIYECNNEDDIRKLFNETNYDSVKNHNYINSATFIQVKMDNFTKLLKKECKDHFGKRDLKKIETFRNELNEIDFFNLYDNSEDLFSYLIKKSVEYYELANYEENLNTNESLFYQTELKPLRNRICFSTTRNNFIQFLKDSDTKILHKFKARKKRITKQLKNKVWSKYYQTDEDMCPINNCTNYIFKNDFEAGHIIAESNGGETILENLRPICKSCNCSMGNKNWFEYEIGL